MTSSTKCILHDRPMNACHVCSGSRYRIRRLYFESQSKCYSLDTGFWLNLYIPISRDFARKNTAHAWTDGPPPATFTVR